MNDEKSIVRENGTDDLQGSKPLGPCRPLSSDNPKNIQEPISGQSVPLITSAPTKGGTMDESLLQKEDGSDVSTSRELLCSQVASNVVLPTDRERSAKAREHQISSEGADKERIDSWENTCIVRDGLCTPGQDKEMKKQDALVDTATNTSLESKSVVGTDDFNEKDLIQEPDSFSAGDGVSKTSPSTQARVSLEAKKQLAFNPPLTAPRRQTVTRISPSPSSPGRLLQNRMASQDESPKRQWLASRDEARNCRRVSTRSSVTSRRSSNGDRDTVMIDIEDPSNNGSELAGTITKHLARDPNATSNNSNGHDTHPFSSMETEVPTIQAKLVEVSEEAPVHATNVDDELRKRHKCYALVVLVFIALVSALSTTLGFVINKSGREPANSKTYVCDTPGLSQMRPGKYEGVSVNYLSFATYMSSPSFPIRAKEFEACTGAKIVFSEAANIWEDPIADLGSKANRGAEIFDGYLMSSSHFPEASHLGLLEHLNDRIRDSNEQIQWQDMLPKVQSIGQFRKDGTSFVDFLMYDGDFFVPIVRLDLLEAHSIPLPNTWDELVEVASFFNGTDLNEDGVPDYGLCHFPRKGAGYWDWWFAECTSWILGFVNLIHIFAAVYGTWASVEQTEGTEQGFLFDETSFEPRVGAGFSYAANVWKELWQNGANCENTNFVEGRCAIGLGPPGCWKQVFQKGVKRVDNDGSLVWQPTMASGEYAEPYRFKTFGSTNVVDRATGEMVPCTRKLCPKAEIIPRQGHHGDDDRAKVLPVSPLEGQLINRAPFYWSGGLGTAIRKSAEPIKKDVLWDFFTYTNSPETSVRDLVDYPSWLDAWRYSQLSPGNNFLAANWSETAFQEHFDIMHWALSKEANGAYNLRLPGAAEYTRDVVGEALRAYIEDLIESEDELVAEVVAGWNKITRKRGKQDQLQIYRASLDLEQLPPE